MEVVSGRSMSKWEVGGGCMGGSEERDRFLRQTRWWGSPRGVVELTEDGPGHGRARAKGATVANALDAH